MLPNSVEAIDIIECEAKEKLEQLKDLIAGDNKLRELRRDDVYLLRFLHSCKFNVENAYAKIEAFYELLVEYPEWFPKTSPVERQDLLKRNMRLCLGERDRAGRIIYLCKIGNTNPSEVTIKEMMSLDDMWFEYMLDDPLTQSKGIDVLIDVAGMSMKLVKWMTPGNIRFGVKKQNCLPATDIVFHVVNTSFIMETCVRLAWPFMSQRLKDSVKFHQNDWDSLHEHISPDVLPTEYGGTSTISYEKMNKRLLEASDKIIEKTKYIDFIIRGK